MFKITLGTVLLSAALFLGTAQAQEVAVGNNLNVSTQTEGTKYAALERLYTSLSTEITSLEDLIDDIVACGNVIKIYGPSNGDADSNGCIEVVVPPPPRGEQAYSTPGTYTFTVPQRVRYITVEVHGAGGGSAPNNCDGHSKCFYGSGGGGAGGYASKSYNVEPGSAYNVVVGQGGGMGGAGGTSRFASMFATGGQPGVGGTDSGGAAGQGYGGSQNLAGGRGGNGATGGKGIYALGTGGQGINGRGNGQPHTAMVHASGRRAGDGFVMIRW